jgi:hypothetical protein
MGSSKPCPGCGEINSSRKSTEVCRDCREKLDLYGELNKEFEKTTLDKITFKIGEQAHWNRYFPVNYPRYEDRAIGQNLRDVIFNVCIAGSIRVSRDGWGNAPHIMSSKTHHGGAVLRASSQEFFDSIQNLMEVVQRAVDLSYEAGRQDGQRFLVDIAEGKKSIQDYNDSLVR